MVTPNQLCRRLRPPRGGAACRACHRGKLLSDNGPAYDLYYGPQKVVLRAKHARSTNSKNTNYSEHSKNTGPRYVVVRTQRSRTTKMLGPHYDVAQQPTSPRKKTALPRTRRTARLRRVHHAEAASLGDEATDHALPEDRAAVEGDMDEARAVECLPHGQPITVEGLFPLTQGLLPQWLANCVLQICGEGQVNGGASPPHQLPKESVDARFLFHGGEERDEGVRHRNPPRSLRRKSAEQLGNRLSVPPCGVHARAPSGYNHYPLPRQPDGGPEAEQADAKRPRCQRRRSTCRPTRSSCRRLLRTTTANIPVLCRDPRRPSHGSGSSRTPTSTTWLPTHASTCI